MSRSVRVRFTDEEYDVLMKIAENMTPPMPVSTLIHEFTMFWFIYTSSMNVNEWSSIAKKVIQNINSMKSKELNNDR